VIYLDTQIKLHAIDAQDVLKDHARKRTKEKEKSLVSKFSQF